MPLKIRLKICYEAPFNNPLSSPSWQGECAGNTTRNKIIADCRKHQVFTKI